MTVAAVVPVARYDGNGITTQFYWSWDMLQESENEVRVNNIFTEDYTTSGNFIVFNTAPAFDDKVLIFRRTQIHQPEDYGVFRGFKANKTELTMDRAFIIAQEIEAGVVGAPDLFVTPQIDGVWVNSERGRDAFLPLWDSELPDPAILWAGNQIDAFHSSTNPLAIASVIFISSAAGGQLGVSNTSYSQNLQTLYVPWLDHEFPSAGEYWMKVTQTNEFSEIQGGQVFEILDRNNDPQTFDVPFDASLAQIKLSTTSALPPAVSFITLNVEICADDGLGAPDDNWASRIVYVALEYTL